MQHDNLSDHLSPLTFVIGSGGERLRHFVGQSHGHGNYAKMFLDKF